MAKKIKMPPNYLDFIFFKNECLSWSYNDNKVVVVDMENKGLYNKLAQILFKKPKVSHISLDKYGTVMWESIDGKNSISDIIHIMEESFPDERKRMLDRVVRFAAVLERNGFIHK